MAVKFQSVSALICERILQEADGITSAIRIVDIFQIASDTPPDALIQFWVLIMLKALPVPDKFKIGVTLVRADGEREKLPDPPGQPLSLVKFADDPSIPSGVTLAIQMNIKPKKVGTSYVEVDADGEALIRIPFTIRRLPSGPVQQ